MKATRLSIFCVAVSVGLCLLATAQQDDPAKKTHKKPAETNARPMTDK